MTHFFTKACLFLHLSQLKSFPILDNIFATVGVILFQKNEMFSGSVIQCESQISFLRLKTSKPPLPIRHSYLKKLA